jgi:hypothetical protein
VFLIVFGADCFLFIAAGTPTPRSTCGSDGVTSPLHAASERHLARHGAMQQLSRVEGSASVADSKASMQRVPVSPRYDNVQISYAYSSLKEHQHW